MRSQPHVRNDLETVGARGRFCSGFRAEDESRERLTRKDFLKVAGTGTAGLTRVSPNRAPYPELTDTVFRMRHPQGEGAGKRSDYYASTHDVAPTILSMLGIERPQQMKGADLSPIFDGKEPNQMRKHFTQGYNNYVWTRDDEYVMLSTNTGTEAKLYDVRQDPGMHKDIAGGRPETVKRMFDDYVLTDAGEPLPNT